MTFPEEYHAENLKGQEAVFKVKVHEVKTKELPELTDEFAKDCLLYTSQEFGGGGHTLACGIPSVTKSQILEVDAKLKEAVRNFKKN